MQRLIDQSIWRCFCRISCSCDFCGCFCGCLTTRCIFLLVLLCFTKEYMYLLSIWSHKGLSIFNLGIVVFWTGTQWFWSGTHKMSDLLTRWVPGLTITICNKITELNIAVRLSPRACVMLCFPWCLPPNNTRTCNFHSDLEIRYNHPKVWF